MPGWKFGPGFPFSSTPRSLVMIPDNFFSLSNISDAAKPGYISTPSFSASTESHLQKDPREIM